MLVVYIGPIVASEDVDRGLTLFVIVTIRFVDSSVHGV